MEPQSRGCEPRDVYCWPRARDLRKTGAVARWAGRQTVALHQPPVNPHTQGEGGWKGPLHLIVAVVCPPQEGAQDPTRGKLVTGISLQQANPAHSQWAPAGAPRLALGGQCDAMRRISGLKNDVQGPKLLGWTPNPEEGPQSQLKKHGSIHSLQGAYTHTVQGADDPKSSSTRAPQPSVELQKFPEISRMPLVLNRD